MLDVDTIRLCATYAAQGRSVLVLEATYPDCRATFDQIAGQLDTTLRRIYSPSGWRIEWPSGGTVRVMVPEQGGENLRGMSPHMVVHPQAIRSPLQRWALMLDATVTVE